MLTFTVRDGWIIKQIYKKKKIQTQREHTEIEKITEKYHIQQHLARIEG